MDMVKSFRMIAVASAMVGIATIQHWRLNSVGPVGVDPVSRPPIETRDRATDSAASRATVGATGESWSRLAESSNVILSEIGDIVRRAQSHIELFERFEAIADLGNFSDPIAEHALVNLLQDPSREIREAAVESLGSLATPGAVRGLSVALADIDDLVRLTAIEILAEIGTSDAIYALAATVNEPNPTVRLSAVSELGELRNAAADSVLQQFLLDGDLRLRATAAEYLSVSNSL
jgi:HEAT repeat protein